MLTGEAANRLQTIYRIGIAAKSLYKLPQVRKRYILILVPGPSTVLAEDNKLAVQSLAELERKLQRAEI